MIQHISGRDLLVNLRTMIWMLSEEHPNTWIDDQSSILYEMRECTHAMLHMWDTHLTWDNQQLVIPERYYNAMLGRHTLIIDYVRQLPEGGIARHGFTKESLEDITTEIGEYIHHIHVKS